MVALMSMLDEMGVNEKVGEIGIRFMNDNPISEVMIEKMSRKYKNMYRIRIVDETDRVYEGI